MTSINTNTGSMVALQTLRSINSNLNKTQSEISTGKTIASAKDNAAVFAISKVMEADVAGFESVSSSLKLGQSTVAVASDAAKKVGELLTSIQQKIVSANEDNLDRVTLNDEITSLRDQISGIVSTAQFNGLNLLDGSASSFEVLSSVSRSTAGGVTASKISLDTAKSNLGSTAGQDLVAGGAVTSDAAAGIDESAIPGGRDLSGSAYDGRTIQNATTTTLTFAGTIAGAGGGAASRNEATNADLTTYGGFIEGDTIQVTLGSKSVSYIVKEGDENTDISEGLNKAFTNAGMATGSFTIADGGGSLSITNNTGLQQVIDVKATRGSGNLADLAGIDVTSAEGAAEALETIDRLIGVAADAQAALGTTAKRLELQSDFMSTMIDSFNSGIGSLVDADMEEVSARLQALQTQQQLGIQSLSIANQAPQNVLSLFK